ncbi:anti-sigma factor domain-containing protein [Methylobacterium sp. NEAU K]|uniref:anti-sigma factor n=1 Tax=Methylobacterium sp. NEAU K TaxID=3064946 RepID=UPI0027369419|nr:anti-sigma factor [Methylobacterium sp. NEAU K]MDP4005524.1 anti-sigma factor [Methylobacterium sp. NEAU K]
MSAGSGGSGSEAAPDPDLHAAEYVLGTLGARERAEMARAIAADPGAAGRVRAWERRLAPLLDAVPPVAPPARVRAALLRSLPGGPVGSPDQLALLRRQVRRWRIAAAGAGLLAAGLALFVAVGSRPEPEGGRYLAVVQGGGALPALIVRVDTRTGIAQVRPVGADAPAGRSLELWYVGAEGPKPLGLVGGTPSRVTLPPGAAQDGVIAVSVEPPGGSPSGRPTGPVVYTGRLIAE